MIHYELVTGFDGVFEAVEHHAEAARPFAIAFAVHLHGTLGASDLEFLVRQSRCGARSWAIHAPDGTAYHLRPFDYDSPTSAPWIGVYDQARNGTMRSKIVAPGKVRPWLKKVEWAARQGRPLWDFFAPLERAPA